MPYKSGCKLVPKNEGAPINSGDTIWLRSGDYGDVTIRKHYNTGVITIAAEKGHTPRFRSLLLQSGSNWALKGLHVSPEFGSGKKPRTMIDVQSHGWNGPIHDILVQQYTSSSTAGASRGPKTQSVRGWIVSLGGKGWPRMSVSTWSGTLSVRGAS